MFGIFGSDVISKVNKEIIDPFNAGGNAKYPPEGRFSQFKNQVLSDVGMVEYVQTAIKRGDSAGALGVYVGASDTVHESDIKNLALSLLWDRAFEIAAAGNPDNATKSVLCRLAKRCPREEKISLFTHMDTSAVFTSCIANCRTAHYAYEFFSNIFQGIETQKAIALVKHSQAWISKLSDANFRLSITEYEPRLIGAFN
ncbi:MAG: hypothetical protein JKX81_13565 [Arenicella sp.]|nr:hypothetical protein [Arenicella sp.]